MSSILKVDTIQDQAGNNIINESGNVITIGASGDTITVPAGATVSGFTSAGIDDNATSVAITIDSSERVGIGTTSPANTLDVNDSAGAVIKITRDSQSSYLQLSTDGSSGQVFSGAGALKFKTGSSEAARFDTSGNLGIGTTTPNRLLTLGGTTNAKLALNTSSYSSFTLGSDVYGFSVYDDDNTAYRLTVKNNGNVGIGTTAPDASDFGSNTGVVHIKDIGASNTGIKLEQGAGKSFWYTNATNTFFGTTTAIPLRLYTNFTERMRIDSSGNVLVGKTSTTNSVAGSKLGPGGQIVATVANDDIMILNRTGTDGKILRLFKDTSEVGNIGVRSGLSDIYIESVSSGRLRANGTDVAGWNSSTGTFFSATDNGNDLGTTANRWNDIYLGGGAYIGGIGSANYLNDYEEGTWTPTLTNQTTAVFSNQTGWYRKIGNTVFIYFSVSLSSKGDISGAYTRIGGIPFTGSPTTRFGSGQIHTYRLGSSAHIQGIEFGGSVGTVGWITTGGGSQTGYLNTSFVANNTFFEGFGIYRTA
jgi:hypothetical protein